MEENIIGTALTQDQISHYNPATNRCYVKLEVSTADLSTPQANFIRDEYLYDGQTKEMLATGSWRGDKKFASVYPDSVRKLVKDPVIPKYEDVDALIDRFMAEDRKP